MHGVGVDEHMEAGKDRAGGAAASAADGGAGSARGAHQYVSSGAKRPHMPTPIAAVEGGAPSSPRKRRVTSTLPAAASTGGGAAGPAAGMTAAQRTVDSHPTEGGHLPSTASGSSRLRALRDRRKELRDTLAGVERDIKKKEIVKETLAEKLKCLDKQLDRPGLRAEDEREIKAQRRMLYGEIGVANAALVGLYEDKRRTKDGVAALEQEIAAEEAARRKADNELPSVVQRLEATEVPDARAQYSRQFLANAGFELRGSDGVVDAIDACVLQNLAPTGEKSNVLVVNGSSGSGKTRVGFEALCRSTGLSGDLLRALEQKAGCPVLTIPLFIDFNNGFSYLDGVDGGNMDENLGVRLAARALRVSAARVRRDNGRSLDGLETAEVLTAIVKGALRRASEAAAAPPGVVLLALHLDEYQVYLKDLMELQGRTSEGAELCFKKMLSAANNWVRSESEAVGAKLVFFPIVTGTPVAGLTLLVTDKLRAVPISPGRLTRESATPLLCDVVCAPTVLSHLRHSVADACRDSAEAINALGDADCRPRFVVTLGEAVRDQLLGVAVAGRQPSPPLVDWAAAVYTVVASAAPPVKYSYVEVLAQLALSKVPVNLFPPKTREPSQAEQAVEEASSVGDVELDVLHGDFRVVRVPLVQLRRWGLTSVLPARLLSQTVCSWQQVEKVLGYCLTAALQPGLRSTPPSIRDLFPGSLGGDCLPSRELVLDKPRSLFVEQSQFISSTTPISPKQMSVLARIESETAYEAVILTDGVFMTCPGCVAVDIRFSVSIRQRGKGAGTLHVFVHTKHSETSRCFGESAVDEWYRSVKAATRKWRSGRDRVLFVYFSTMPLTAAGAAALDCRQFFTAHPDLLVVTSDQLSNVLPAFLLSRFLTAEQQRRERMGVGARHS
ncbi:hypothetical protein I4F81_010100 [Pyropia yezoensis]|uniref:Uncharacterized protein n=1 Tax=Pyropia yezoensis TaxID=2788 RepID=A0ACC3CCB3_PYRYE|nr:hypothetical protein I4F81_010100 [Neopyropia yezoensis]